MGFFKLRAYDPEDILPNDALVKAALAHTETIESSWNAGPLFECDTQTYAANIGSDYWVARVSYHKEIEYSTFKETILDDHTKYEAQYIPMIKGYESLDVPARLEGWHSESITYTFPFPFSPRVMVVWMYTREIEEGSKFIVISLPRSMDKGAYISIEILEKLEDGTVRWTMAQTSDAGGWLPKWAQKPAIASSIAKDVPLYKSWLRRRAREAEQAKREADKKAEQAQQAAAQPKETIEPPKNKEPAVEGSANVAKSHPASDDPIADAVQANA